MTHGKILTGNACEELASEALNLAVGEWNKVVHLQKVKDTRAQEVHDDTNMTAVVEAVAQMYASIPVFGVVCLECLQDS